MTAAGIQELVARGHYGLAYDHAIRLLEEAELPLHERVQVLLDAARAAGEGLGRYHECARLAAEAAQEAEKAGLHEEGQIARLAAGEARRRLGDWPEAEDWFMAFLDADRGTLADNRLRGVACYGLGMVARSRNQWDTATQYFRRAAAEFERENQWSHLMNAYHMLGWSYILSGCIQEAAEPIRNAAILAPQVPEELRVQQITLEALYALRTGDISKACEMCADVLAPGRSGVTALARAEASMVGAEAATLLGQTEQARMLAEAAMDAAREAQEVRIINRANAVLRMIRGAEG